MLEMRAIVIQVQGDDASVQPLGGGGCGHCDSEGGCGSSKLTQLFCSKPRNFIAHNEAHAKIGDEVQVELADGVLLSSAIRMYIIPVALVLVGGMLGAYLADNASGRDAYAVIGAVIGLLCGFLLARLSAFRSARPVLRTIVSSPYHS